MEPLKPNLPMVVVLLVVGVSSLIRFSGNLFHLSQNVRVVDVVGVSGGGAACGAALFAFIFALASRKRV